MKNVNKNQNGFFVIEAAAIAALVTILMSSALGVSEYIDLKDDPADQAAVVQVVETESL